MPTRIPTGRPPTREDGKDVFELVPDGNSRDYCGCSNNSLAGPRAVDGRGEGIANRLSLDGGIAEGSNARQAG